MDCSVRSFRFPSVTVKTLRPILVTQNSRTPYLMMDEAPVYKKAARTSQPKVPQRKFRTMLKRVKCSL